MIVRGGFMIFPHVVVCGGAQKVTHRKLRQKLGAHVERLDGEGVILILVGGHGQLPVGLTPVRFELQRRHKFLLRLPKLPLLQKTLTEAVVQVCIVGVLGKQGTEECLSICVPACSCVNVGQIALGGGIVGSELQPSLKFNGRVVVFLVGREHPAQLDVRHRIVGILCNDLTQVLLRLLKAVAAHVYIGEPYERLRRSWI